MFVFLLDENTFQSPEIYFRVTCKHKFVLSKTEYYVFAILLCTIELQQHSGRLGYVRLGHSFSVAKVKAVNLAINVVLSIHVL